VNVHKYTWNTRDAAIKARIIAGELGLYLVPISSDTGDFKIPPRNGVKNFPPFPRAFPLFIESSVPSIAGFRPVGHKQENTHSISDVWFLRFLGVENISILNCRSIVRKVLAMEDSDDDPILLEGFWSYNQSTDVVHVLSNPLNGIVSDRCRLQDILPSLQHVSDHDMGTVVAMCSFFRQPYRLVSPEIISFIGRVFKTHIPSFQPLFHWSEGVLEADGINAPNSVSIAYYRQHGWRYSIHKTGWEQFLDITSRLSPERASCIQVDTILLPSCSERKLLMHITPYGTYGDARYPSVVTLRGFWISVTESEDGSLVFQEDDIGENVPDGVLFYKEPSIHSDVMYLIQKLIPQEEGEWLDHFPTIVPRFVTIAKKTRQAENPKPSVKRFLYPLFMALREYSEPIGYLPIVHSNVYRLPDGSEAFLDWIDLKNIVLSHRFYESLSNRFCGSIPCSCGQRHQGNEKVPRDLPVLERLSSGIPNETRIRRAVISILQDFGISADVAAGAMIKFGESYGMKEILSAGKSLHRVAIIRLGTSL